MQMNFQNLPDEQDEQVQPGRHRLRVKEALVTVSQNSGNTMILVKNELPDQNVNLQIYDYYPLFDEEGNAVNSGQAKLKSLLENTNTIPEGDFTPKLIATLIEGKEYSAELVEEEYRGKKQVKVGHHRSFEPVEEQKNSKPTRKETPTPQDKMDPDVQSALDQGDTSIDDDDEL